MVSFVIDGYLANAAKGFVAGQSDAYFEMKNQVLAKVNIAQKLSLIHI